VQRRIRIRNITCHKRRCRPRVPVQFASYIWSVSARREISEGPHPALKPSKRSLQLHPLVCTTRRTARRVSYALASICPAYKYVRANRLAHVREAVDSQLGTRKLPLNRPRQVARSERRRPFSRKRISPFADGATRDCCASSRARLPASLQRG